MEQNPTRKSRLSSGRFKQRIVIELDRSRWHARLIILAHVFTVVVVALASLPAPLLYIAEFSVLASLTNALHRIRHVHAAISVPLAGELKIRTNPDRSWVQVDIQSVFISGWLIVITLREQHASGSIRLVCFPDSVLPDEFRRLAIYLRLYGPASARRAD